MARSPFLSLALLVALATGAAAAPRPAPPAPQPSQPAPRDDQWALLVGIGDYPGGIQKLNYPRSDAEAIQRLLVSRAGFRPDHIRLLTDAAGDSRATKQNILAAVDDYLAPRVQPGHQVIVFLAGHGIARGLGAQAKSFFLPVDVDATKEKIEQTAIDLEAFGRKLGALRASQFVLFVDACREDPFPGRGLKGNTLTDVMARSLRVVGDQPAEAGREPPSAVIFYSCEVGQRAWEDPQLEHGVFTAFILRGIGDLADRPDGRVEAGRLAGYLQESVAKWSEQARQRLRFDVEQTPTMVPARVRGPVVVVHVTPFSSNVPSPPTTGTVVLASSPDDATLAVDGQKIGAGTVEKPLPPGAHTVRAERPGYQPEETTIQVYPGYRQEVPIALKPIVKAPAQPNLDRGLQAEAAGLWPQAVAAYEAALRDDPDAPGTYERLGDAYRRGGRYRDAVDLLWTAAQKFPDNASILAGYSRALSLWKPVGKGDDHSLNPRPRPAGRSSAKPPRQDDADREALKAGEQATQKDARLAAAFVALGYAYLLREKERPKAVTAFGNASVLAPEDPETYYAIGYTYRLMQDYLNAIPQLRKALEMRPDYYEAHRELAYCYLAAGDSDHAIHQYQVASSYRGATDDSAEMASNSLALSALYTQKGKQTAGDQGQALTQTGKGYEGEAREYDPTLEGAMRKLAQAGVAHLIREWLPPDATRFLDKLRNIIPGIRLPF